MTRLGKRKRPLREVKAFKEKKKIESDVFDRDSLPVFGELFNKKILSSVDYPVSEGKEAIVFRATAGERGEVLYYAAKVYRIETSFFIRQWDYILGDPRFARVKKAKRNLVYAWTQKEFRNLLLCEQAGVPVPKPYYFNKNVLIMEFLGEEGIPDSTLQQMGSENPEQDCQTLLGYIKKLYQHGLVHGDVSEFNVMVHKGTLFLIDVGQGVLLAHPKSQEFLARDVRNVLGYFAKHGVKRDYAEALAWVKGGSP